MRLRGRVTCEEASLTEMMMAAYTSCLLDRPAIGCLDDCTWGFPAPADNAPSQQALRLCRNWVAGGGGDGNCCMRGRGALVALRTVVAVAEAGFQESLFVQTLADGGKHAALQLHTDSSGWQAMMMLMNGR